MKLLGLGTLLSASAGLAAGWSVAFADAVARDAFHAPRLDLASLGGLARGMFALAGGTATTKRAKRRRGFVDTVVSNALFLTMVGHGMRRDRRRTRVAIAAGGVAALSIVPLLPQRHAVLGTLLSFVVGGAAGIVAMRLGEGVHDSELVSAALSGSTGRSPRDDDPSTRPRLAA